MAWSEEAETVLFAALNYSIAEVRRSGTKPSKRLVLPKIQSQLKKQKLVRRQDEIDAYLHSFTLPLRSTRRRRISSNIYEDGTKCFLQLTNTMRRKIAAEVVAIREQEVYLMIDTPRSLRSSSRKLPEGVISDFKREGTEFHGLHSPLAGKFSVRKATPRIPHDDRNQSELPATPSAPTGSPFSSKPNSPVCENEATIARQDSPICVIPPSRNSFEEFYRSEVSKNSHASAIVPRNGLFQGESIQDLWQLPQIQELDRENQYLRQKCAVLEGKLEKAQFKPTNDQALNRDGNGQSREESMEKVIREKDEQYRSLRREWKQQKDLLHHFKKDAFNVKNLDEELRQKHDEMVNALHSVFLKYWGVSGLQDKISQAGSPDLKELKEYAGLPCSALDTNQKTIGLHILESLAGAAIGKWVFCEPVTTFQFFESSLLGAYRKVLRAFAGSQKTRRIDAAAHEEVINSDAFRDAFLHAKVAELTRRFMHMIAPLMKDKNQPKDKIQPANWSELYNEVEELFKLGMQVRLIALYAYDEVRVIWPSLQSPFQWQIMRERGTERSESMRERGNNSRVVAIVTAPGLQILPTKGRELTVYHALPIASEPAAEQQSVIIPAVVVSC